jgi:hypothetical protein
VARGAAAGGHVGFRTTHGGSGVMPKGRDSGGAGGPTCRRARQWLCRQNAWRADPRAEALPLRVFRARDSSSWYVR